MPSLDERVAILEHRQDESERRFNEYVKDAHGQRMKLLAASEAACDMSRRIMADTATMRELETDIRVIARAVRTLSVLIKWSVRWVVVPCLVVYAFFYALAHEGHPPKWIERVLSLFS